MPEHVGACALAGASGEDLTESASRVSWTLSAAIGALESGSGPVFDVAKSVDASDDRTLSEAVAVLGDLNLMVTQSMSESRESGSDADTAATRAVGEAVMLLHTTQDEMTLQSRIIVNGVVSAALFSDDPVAIIAETTPDTHSVSSDMAQTTASMSGGFEPITISLGLGALIAIGALVVAGVGAVMTFVPSRRQRKRHAQEKEYAAEQERKKVYESGVRDAAKALARHIDAKVDDPHFRDIKDVMKPLYAFVDQLPQTIVADVLHEGRPKTHRDLRGEVDELLVSLEDAMKARRERYRVKKANYVEPWTTKPNAQHLSWTTSLDKEGHRLDFEDDMFELKTKQREAASRRLKMQTETARPTWRMGGGEASGVSRHDGGVGMMIALAGVMSLALSVTSVLRSR